LALSFTGFEIRPVLHWKCTFSYPLSFNANFENVPIALHPANFVHSKPQQRAYYFCKSVLLWPTC